MRNQPENTLIGQKCTRMVFNLRNYCISLYGIYLNEKVLESVYIIYRKCVRRIFKVLYNAHCNLVHLIKIGDHSSVKIKLHKRF